MAALKIRTDDTLRELACHGSPDYPFACYLDNIWQFDFHRVDWHWHYELEFWLFPDEGASGFIGENRIELPKSSGIFINSGALHRFEAGKDASFPNIVFSPLLLAPENTRIYDKYIAPVINSSLTYQIFELHIPWQKQILEILDQVFLLQNGKDRNELRTLQLLLQIWDILRQNIDIRPGVPADRRLNNRQAKLQTMMQYIHDHYSEEITLEMIADAASVSKSGALNIFRSCISISPVAYLIHYRLTQAAMQLKTTQKSVSEIAAETGFSDSGYFCRKFRQLYHMTAMEYRYEKKSLSKYSS